MKKSLLNSSINGENDYTNRIDLTKEEVTEIQVDEYHIDQKQPLKEESKCTKFLKSVSLG